MYANTQRYGPLPAWSGDWSLAPEGGTITWLIPSGSHTGKRLRACGTRLLRAVPMCGHPSQPFWGNPEVFAQPQAPLHKPPCVLKETPHLRSSQPRAVPGMDSGSSRGHSSCHLCPPSPALLTLGTPWVTGRAAFQHVALLYEVCIFISSARCEIHNTR